MMSKERELLRETLHVLTSSKVWDGQEYTYLPVHPCQYKKIADEIQKLFAQPEQDSIQYLLDQVARLTAENSMLKEKWSTPKREPLSDDEILKLCLYADEISEEAFYRGARQIEKEHGIGE